MKNQAEQVQRWEDLIFERRNKEYGAYVIRQRYSDSVFKSILISAGAATLLILFAVTVKEKPIVVPEADKSTVFTFNPTPDIKPVATPKSQLPKKASNPNLAPKPVTQEVPDKPVDQTPTTGSTDGVENNTGSVTSGNELIETEVTIAAPVEQKVYIAVEKMPSYNGGVREMMKFLSKKLKYPRRAEINKIQGTVYVQFVISPDGSIAQVELMKGIDKDCDQEAMRVIQLMPGWTPGYQNNMPVSVRMILPITFKLGQQ